MTEKAWIRDGERSFVNTHIFCNIGYTLIFRYNEADVPVEVMLLDLQVCRQASLATDLNYLFHTSLEGQVRKTNLQTLLDIYFSAFLRVTEEGKRAMPFSRQELRQEYRNHLEFGLLNAVLLNVMVLCEGGINKEDQEGFSESMRDALDQLVSTSPLLRPRFLCIFDEMIENEIIKWFLVVVFMSSVYIINLLS